jgi:hypothetical protein
MGVTPTPPPGEGIFENKRDTDPIFETKGDRVVVFDLKELN